jgi:hypothetical protein
LPKNVDLNGISEAIDKLYGVGLISFKLPSDLPEEQKYKVCEERLEKLNDLVAHIIMKNRHIFQKKQLKTILASGIYLACKKNGIKITYNDLYFELGVTGASLRRTLKSLRLAS